MKPFCNIFFQERYKYQLNCLENDSCDFQQRFACYIFNERNFFQNVQEKCFKITDLGATLNADKKKLFRKKSESNRKTSIVKYCQNFEKLGGTYLKISSLSFKKLQVFSSFKK